MKIIALIIAVLGGAITLFMKQYKIGPWNPTIPESEPVDPPAPPTLPQEESKPETPTVPESVPPALDFSSPRAAYHSTRVLCDELGLTFPQKNELCACIYQESRFNNGAVGKNPKSTDWGIVQVNDTPGWHIGPGLEFPSVQFVVANPETCVRWMIRMYKEGRINYWASHSSGAYKQWLRPDSPLWTLG